MSGVEFFDGPDEPTKRPQGPNLHHFRSSDLKREEQHLQHCWEKCLTDDAVVIPHRIIRLYDQIGDSTSVINTNCLHIEDDESDEDGTPTDQECQEEYPDVAESESVEEINEDEFGEEVTTLEEVVTSVVKDLSIEYNDCEVLEQQTLAAPLVSTGTITRLARGQPENKDLSNTNRSQKIRALIVPQVQQCTRRCK